MDRTTPFATPLVTVLILALSGCGSDSSPSASAPASPATSSPVPVTSPTASITPSTVTKASPAATSSADAGVSSATRTRAAAAPPARSAAPGETLLVLEPDGIGLLRGTSVRHFTFGSDLTAVSAALSATLGPLSRSTQTACGQGSRMQLAGKGFSALFDGAQFVGWTDTGQTATKLTTMNGIGVGTTLATLQSRSPGVEITEGSLGPEWAASAGTAGRPTLGGLLDGASPQSKVTTVYAGETCFFR